MQRINLFVLAFTFAIFGLYSSAPAQEKKEPESKDVTTEAQKWIDGNKLQLGGKASNRHIVLDKGMTVTKATRKGKELTIVLDVPAKTDIKFVNLDDLINVTYDPVKGKTLELKKADEKGKANFPTKGTLTISAPDESALQKPAEAPRTFGGPKKRKK